MLLQRLENFPVLHQVLRQLLFKLVEGLAQFVFPRSLRLTIAECLLDSEYGSNFLENREHLLKLLLYEGVQIIPLLV